MKIKIIDGTPHGSPHLCRSCCYSIIRLESDKEIIACRKMPSSSPYIRGRVTSCSSYSSHEQQLAMSRFRGQAWFLDMDEDGNLEWITPARRSNPRPTSRGRRRNPALLPPPAEPTVQ